MERAEENWLRAKAVRCPQCETLLFQVDHSPFDDCWRIYCNGCAKSAEVSFYDAVVASVRGLHPPQQDSLKFFREIERRLRPCSCGGSFLFDAVRRCYHCNCAASDDPAVDLHPFTGSELEAREPSEEETAVHDEHRRLFIRSCDLWIEGDGEE
jgi:hypothetical protein